MHYLNRPRPVNRVATPKHFYTTNYHYIVLTVIPIGNQTPKADNMATNMNNSQNTSALPSEAQPPNKTQMMIQVAPPVSLPQTLTAYRDPEEVSSKFYLGDSSNRKMFAVTSHGGLTGDRRSIKVYSGPSTDDPLFSPAVPLDESRTRRTLQAEYNPETCPPNPPCRWRKTPKPQVSDSSLPSVDVTWKISGGPRPSCLV